MRHPRSVNVIGLCLTVAECSGVAAPDGSGPVISADSPPAATLQIDGSEQVAGVGTHCWPYAEQDAAICADYLKVVTPEQPLVVSSPVQGSIIWLMMGPPDRASGTMYPVTEANEMEIDGPTRVWKFPGEAAASLDLADPGSFTLSADSPGLYVISVFVVGQGYRGREPRLPAAGRIRGALTRENPEPTRIT